MPSFMLVSQFEVFSQYIMSLPKLAIKFIDHDGFKQADQILLNDQYSLEFIGNILICL